MIDFKPTRGSLLAHANSLEKHAKDSLTSWIILGMSEKYSRVMGAVYALRAAADMKRIGDRRDYLRDVDASF
tara:strand:- start:224 stop:439 length:216 start_codon:yes stop_codon:yes gene_type:complete